ncbi:DUF6171 family protein [Alkalicoccobacillus murimartini]|uniref:Uncharacterized protein n=1 Tax=Alkalicoccobacillus murimartini TaxID=171685 RepID=A0ABT9YKG5_9BACI|nr:DUF6171 family protein [Alkalicoccobacillus murimartini]MDQ0208352.1 hypothetical protein [Alkalicoccobacillus murimartini]
MACKGCLLEEDWRKTSVQTLIDEQLAFETDVVSDEYYRGRLTLCEACPSLVSNTTCKHCGCFVGFRAKLSYKGCPYPGTDKWKEAEIERI